MTWQWVVFSLGCLAFVAVMTYLANKKAGVDKGLEMMESNNVILKAYMDQMEAKNG